MSPGLIVAAERGETRKPRTITTTRTEARSVTDLRIRDLHRTDSIVGRESNRSQEQRVVKRNSGV
jgi:hypothetical protein